ncbi:hypothetical protein DFH08DRAFT_802317 [Mycena albidolilacea]|uniref:Uncharacterized protein n=1 Tax=Mycena albidolilacea TaxID=1033008 RepID=A0AAD7F0U2_9AGAR|nr:hypothetical protein DFH08DRAFT_802317 [Mycena albidolilacea]
MFLKLVCAVKMYPVHPEYLGEPSTAIPCSSADSADLGSTELSRSASDAAWAEAGPECSEENQDLVLPTTQCSIKGHIIIYQSLEMLMFRLLLTDSATHGFPFAAFLLDPSCFGVCTMRGLILPIMEEDLPTLDVNHQYLLCYELIHQSVLQTHYG